MRDWIAVDGEPTSAPDGVSIDAAGVVCVAAGEETRAAWDDVLGVTRVESTVYVLVPRRPPQPPWIALDAPTLGRDPAELARDLQSRSQRTGYRDARPGAPLLDPSELRARVLARDEVAGAVEVPARFAIKPRPPGEAFWAMGGAGVGTSAGVAVAMAAHLAYPAFPMVVLGTAGMVAAVKVIRALHRPARPRILVLAPDGLVASIEGVIRALRWDDVTEFHLARSRDGDVGVRITTAGGAHQWIDVLWLDAPVDLVLAIAEAYRARWSSRG